MLHNDSVREQTVQEKLELTVQERILKRLGNVQRMSDERIAKQVLHWVPEDRRERGQPSITWQDMVNKDIEEGRRRLTWDEAMSLTANRSKWRNWIA